MQKTISGGIIGLMLATALPVAAQSTAATAPSADIQCVQKAVIVREDAIIAAWTAFNTATMNALTARKTALVEAWGMSDATARRVARKKGWDGYVVAHREAHKTLKTARKQAWDTFKTASKACNVPVVEAHGADSHGSIGL